MKKIDDYKKYPKGKGRMIEEIINIFDDYDNDKVKDSVFIELMKHYQCVFAYAEYDFFINGYVIDESIVKKIGKNRAERLEQILKHG